MTTTTQISSILNPVRVLKVADWEKVAAIINHEEESRILGAIRYNTETRHQELLPKQDVGNNSKLIAINLLSRYESITSQPLQKEMFVNSVEKPKEPTYAIAKGIQVGSDIGVKLENEYESRLNIWRAAQKKILFEGFENTADYYVENSRIGIDFHHLPINATISDLIIEIDRYNRTASKPVEINFSENFIQELIK